MNPIIISSHVWSPQRTGFFGVGVGRVVGRVVEVGHALDLRPRRHPERLGEPVAMLPVEVVAGHAEQDLLLPVRVMGSIKEVLSAEVHVGHQREQFGIS